MENLNGDAHGHARGDGDHEAIVVGVDGSPESVTALRWAAAEADRRALPVLAVMAWEPPIGTWASPMGGIPADAFARRDFAAEAERELVDAVAPVRAEFPDVVIDTRARIGPPVPTLLTAAQSYHAPMLVVGSRGSGGFARLLLGSVGEQCATHADRTVVIVRP